MLPTLSPSFLSSTTLLLLTGSCIPNPSLTSYISRFLPLSSTITPSIQLQALYYIPKLSIQNPSLSIHKLFLASLILADIASNDHSFSMKSWSRVAGITKDEVVKLRRSVLVGMDYDILISRDEYGNWVKYLNEVLKMQIGGNINADAVKTNHQKSMQVEMVT